jgi:hypothetical protein
MWYRLDDSRSDAFREGWVMTQDGFQVMAISKDNEFIEKLTGWKVQPVRVWM